MSSSSVALTSKVESGSPYQLDQDQILKASRALLKHMKESSEKIKHDQSRKSLLTEGEDPDADEESNFILLNLTTKKHIIHQKRLKPAKISIPHSLHTSPTTKICLITADPQRTYKDIIASPAFPSDLSKRITRVIGFQKLQAKYRQFEAQRQLLAEHDVFIADDRVITRLPKLLGKTFYKSTTKRPIPVSLQASAPRSEGKRIARAKSDGPGSAGDAKQIAAEVTKAIQGALVHLSPSTNTSVRVAYANWDSKMVAENVEVVAKELIQRFVPKKWRGVRGVHIKGPTTTALPIWLADELWVVEGDVVDEQAKAIDEEKKKKSIAANVGKKRKAVESMASEGAGQEGTKKEKKAKKQKLLKEKESDDTRLDKEIASRKGTLRKQKEEAAKDAGDEVPKATKTKTKSKKSKAVVA